MKSDSTAQRKLKPRNKATEPPKPTVNRFIVINTQQRWHLINFKNINLLISCEISHIIITYKVVKIEHNGTHNLGLWRC